MSRANHCKRLLEKLNTQRAAGFLCDCTVFIGDFQFKGHRNVLASFSEYFRALFKDALDRVVLDGKLVTASGFQTLLDFIYSGDLRFERCSLKEILLAAEHLQLEQVISLCRDRMVPHGKAIKKAALDPNQKASRVPSGVKTITDEPESACAFEEAKKTIDMKKTNRSKKWKRVMHSQQGFKKKSAQYQNLVKQTDLHIDTSTLAESIAELGPLDRGTCLLQLPPALESEAYLPQDITAEGRQGPVKAQQAYALKERQAANIVRDICAMESSQTDMDQKNKPVCSSCGKVFSEASSLRRHMRIHKGVKPYVCQLCGKAFTQCNQLKTHERTHTGEKPYQCKLCDKGFAQKCQLVFHSRMHHGEEKPYKCEVCNLQFATSSNLKIHVRKHSGEKPYVCDRCGQRFAQASTLTYHVRRHTGEKPYVCDTCGKAFAVSSSLITHARKHTGEKPHICGVCGKSFISSGELNKHFRSHTGEKPFACEQCGTSYTDVTNLKKHKLKMHSETATLALSSLTPSPVLPFTNLRGHTALLILHHLVKVPSMCRLHFMLWRSIQVPNHKM
uniref:Myoneurin n=1 Tax=Leptobrachium leishanense TaxID=445787 RepID=A0A8C5WC70_9ANUR